MADVSPRDGLQNEPRVVATDEKARLVSMLCDCGVDEVEVSSFVSPKWVPSLSDASDLFDWVCDELAVERGGALPVLSALVPNSRGFERAHAVHERLRLVGIGGLKIAFFTAASEAFSERNTNASIAASIERFAGFAGEALRAGMPLRVYVSCAVACPFSGPVAPREVRRVVDALRRVVGDGAWEGVDIDLGDTIGVARPDDIDGLLGAFDDADIAHMTLHLHDTHGRAASCVVRGLERGVRSFDGAAGGLGGCPYAQAEGGSRAPGNIDTGVLVSAIEGAGFTTGVDRGALAAASAFASGLTRDGAEETSDA